MQRDRGIVQYFGPVLPLWARLTELPTELMDSKSPSLKVASLRTSSAGPCCVK